MIGENRNAVVAVVAGAFAAIVVARRFSTRAGAAKASATAGATDLPVLVGGLFQKEPFPNASPFVAKLDAILRKEKFAFSTERRPGIPRPKNGKVPALFYKGDTVCDSELIVKRLVKDGAIKQHPNAWLDPVTRAHSEMFRLSIENFIYYRLGKERWVNQFGETIFVVRPNVVATYYKTGTTRYPEDAWVEMESNFWNNAAVLLGEKRFFFSDEHMCMADFTAFGILANIVQFPQLSPKLFAAVSKHQNLIDFVAHVKEDLYPELRIGE
ncbi:UNVERIFIED_CONTAM: hypothetical protein HDU68_006235 [Siphonaria sp. JEL0065]|nr:hypothetical protein HDU68_006235 [Siphonaria sp. JEL0065]